MHAHICAFFRRFLLLPSHQFVVDIHSRNNFHSFIDMFVFCQLFRARFFPLSIHQPNIYLCLFNSLLCTQLINLYSLRRHSEANQHEQKKNIYEKNLIVETHKRLGNAYLLSTKSSIHIQTKKKNCRRSISICTKYSERIASVTQNTPIT